MPVWEVEETTGAPIQWVAPEIYERLSGTGLKPKSGHCGAAAFCVYTRKFSALAFPLLVSIFSS